VVGRADDGDEDGERVEGTDEEADGTTGARHADAAEEREVQVTATVGGRERERANREADNEAVAELQRGHGNYNSSLAPRHIPNTLKETNDRKHWLQNLFCVHMPDVSSLPCSVHKAKSSRKVAQFTRYSRVTQQTRRHARPQREEDKRAEVAHGHRVATSLVDERV